MKTRPIKSVQMKDTASSSHSKGKTVLVSRTNQHELPTINCGPFKQIPEYEPLHDSLSDFFRSKQKKLHLKKQGILDKNNRILNNRVIKDNEIYEQRNMNRFIKENGIVPICEVPIVPGIKTSIKAVQWYTKTASRSLKTTKIKLNR